MHESRMGAAWTADGKTGQLYGFVRLFSWIESDLLSDCPINGKIYIATY